VIPAEEEISPLDFFELVDGGVTVYGTSGLEMALHGKPVILAGEAHYGGKGFTYDGLTIATYRELLYQAVSLQPLSEEQRRLARQYAYSFFIQRQVPFPVVKNPNSAWWEFQFDKRKLLLPGNDPFVDLICDRILDGQDFVMDENLVGLSNGHEEGTNHNE
jgi:capsule polysaccharide export protein KpsC/LpsZ